MHLRYRVDLEASERRQLEEVVTGGTRAGRRVKRAQILLAAAAGQTDDAIATTVRVGTSTVYRTKRRFVEESVEAALSEDPRPGGRRKLTGGEEAVTAVEPARRNHPDGADILDAQERSSSLAWQICIITSTPASRYRAHECRDAPVPKTFAATCRRRVHWLDVEEPRILHEYIIVVRRIHRHRGLDSALGSAGSSRRDSQGGLRWLSEP